LTSFEAALCYLKRGWSVVPLHISEGGICSCGGRDCDRAGKHPRIEWSAFQRRLPKETEVRAWFSRWPDANVGIVTGSVSDLVVQDIDGEEAAAYARQHGLPPTPVVRTGRGEHRYYRHPGREVRNFAGRVPGLDLRGDGGYVVAPPSLHPSGARYEWLLGPDDADLSEVPEWLLAMTTGPGETPKDEPDWIDRAWAGFSEGQRNEMAARLAGHYLRTGLPERETLHILGSWNERNRPPLPEKELAQVVRSISRRESEGGGRNFTIERVQKIQADHPIYIVRVFGCDVQVAGEALASFTRFQQAVLQAVDRMPTMRSPAKHWAAYLNDVLSNRLELLETPEEASESAIVWARTLRYLASRASDEPAALADGRGVYSNETVVYFSGTSLKAHLDSVGVSVKANALWNLVRINGGRSLYKHIRDEEGRRRTVRCWTLPKQVVFTGSPEEGADGDVEII
jgi:hypothetical protein